MADFEETVKISTDLYSFLHQNRLQIRAHLPAILFQKESESIEYQLGLNILELFGYFLHDDEEGWLRASLEPLDSTPDTYLKEPVGPVGPVEPVPVTQESSPEDILFKSVPNSVEFGVLNDALDRLECSPLPVKQILELKYKHKFPKGWNCSSPSIVWEDGKFTVCIRGVNYHITPDGNYIANDPQNIVRTQNLLVDFTDRLKAIPKTERMLVDVSENEKYPFRVSGLEDVRLFGKSAFVCTSLEHNPQHIPEVCLGQFDEQTGEITFLKPIRLDSDRKVEKNWMPFFIGEEVYFIYSFQPFRIYRLAAHYLTPELIVDKNLVGETHTNFEKFRGSGPPIRYTLGGEEGWLMSAHLVWYSSTSRQRRYYHKFVWFDRLFGKMKVSPMFFFEGRQVEFTLSVCHSKEGLLVPYSVEDGCAKVAIVDYKVLDSMLITS